MATELLAVGTTAADSADVVVAAGDQLTVSLKDAAGPLVGNGALVYIQLKDDAAEYFTVDMLYVDTFGARKSAVVIAAAGTYRFSRLAGVSCGVFSG